jgi:hypothetical protein
MQIHLLLKAYFKIAFYYFDFTYCLILIVHFLNLIIFLKFEYLFTLLHLTFIFFIIHNNFLI